MKSDAVLFLILSAVCSFSEKALSSIVTKNSILYLFIYYVCVYSVSVEVRERTACSQLSPSTVSSGDWTHVGSIDSVGNLPPFYLSDPDLTLASAPGQWDIFNVPVYFWMQLHRGAD